MRSFANTVATLGILALLVPALSTAAKQEQEALPCADCHDTLAADFQSNPHAVALGRDAVAGAVCAACHAGGKEHIDAGGDAKLIHIPKGPGGAAVCLKCHGGKDHNDIEPKGFHATAGVTCDTCHSIHGAPRPGTSLLKAPDSELCVSCHPDVRDSFLKPYAHRMNASVGGTTKAGMQCYSCHNPHGRADRNLKQTAAGESVCLSCHIEKRGPYVFTHGSLIAGDCMSCHDNHGSPNPMMLKRSTVAQVCLECHSNITGTTLGSQPPSLHDLRSPRYQNCTTCHTAIHGSNVSPRLFR
jgi:DmsE family decaheme c-type cytochrome